MKKQLFYFLTLIIFTSVLTSSCKKDDDTPTEPETYTLTQADLNKATNPEDLDVTGTPYGQFARFYF